MYEGGSEGFAAQGVGECIPEGRIPESHLFMRVSHLFNWESNEN